MEKYLDFVESIVEYRLEQLTFYINLGYYFFYNDKKTQLEKIKTRINKLITANYLQVSVEQLYKYQLLIDVIEEKVVFEQYEKFNEIGLGKLLNQVKNKYVS